MRAPHGRANLAEQIQPVPLGQFVVLTVGSNRLAFLLLADHAPVAGMVPLEGKAAAYVCENFTCRLPTSDPERFAELLE